MDNKSIFAANLKKYMDMNQKTRRDIAQALGLSYYTVSDWVNGKKYPRMDKVEMLANYFGIQKSDLIEGMITPEKGKDNEVMADIIVRMRMDEEFRGLVESLYLLDAARIKGVGQMLHAFTQQPQD